MIYLPCFFANPLPIIQGWFYRLINFLIIPIPSTTGSELACTVQYIQYYLPLSLSLSLSLSPRFSRPLNSQQNNHSLLTTHHHHYHPVKQKTPHKLDFFSCRYLSHAGWGRFSGVWHLPNSCPIPRAPLPSISQKVKRLKVFRLHVERGKRWVVTFCVRTQKAIVRWISWKAWWAQGGEWAGCSWGAVDVHVVVLSLSISLSHTHTLTHTLLSVGIPGLGGMDGD